jgi:hypothetical protein
LRARLRDIVATVLLKLSHTFFGVKKTNQMDQSAHMDWDPEETKEEKWEEYSEPPVDIRNDAAMQASLWARLPLSEGQRQQLFKSGAAHTRVSAGSTFQEESKFDADSPTLPPTFPPLVRQ